MQYPYDFNNLVPLSINIDLDGDTHCVYNLPAPKQWVFKEYISGVEVRETEHTVTRVRVCLMVDGCSNRPIAIVVPFDESGKEAPTSSIHFMDTVSIVGVLSGMGFTPSHSAN